MGDGWIIAGAGHTPTPQIASAISKVRTYATDAGRNPSNVGFEKVVSYAGSPASALAEAAAKWQSVGLTHLSINTMRANLSRPSEHIEALIRFKEALEGAGKWK